jgi:hypothetical protein
MIIRPADRHCLRWSIEPCRIDAPANWQFNHRGSEQLHQHYYPQQMRQRRATTNTAYQARNKTQNRRERGVRETDGK